MVLIALNFAGHRRNLAALEAHDIAVLLHHELLALERRLCRAAVEGELDRGGVLGHHRVRMAIKPGLTGMWQVSGRSSITDFEEVVALDLKYIREWSIGLDIRILLKTVKIVLTGSGSQ